MTILRHEIAFQKSLPVVMEYSEEKNQIEKLGISSVFEARRAWRLEEIAFVRVDAQYLRAGASGLCLHLCRKKGPRRSPIGECGMRHIGPVPG